MECRKRRGGVFNAQPQNAAQQRFAADSPDACRSADEARRRVNGFLLNNLSYLMIGDRETELAVGEKVYWRFSINHTLPGFGSIGRIGTIDVDVETGEIQPASPEQIEEMKRRAKILAGSYPFDTSPAR